jgi:hypothetical protein
MRGFVSHRQNKKTMGFCKMLISDWNGFESYLLLFPDGDLEYKNINEYKSYLHSPSICSSNSSTTGYDCNLCGKDIKYIRYKCYMCINMDLCSAVFFNKF